MSLSAGVVSLSVKPDTKDFGSELKSKLLGHTAGVGESMGGMLKDGLKSMVGPVAAVAAGMSIEHVVEGSIHSFENLGGEVVKMKRLIGGSVEDVSALRGAFQLSGVDVDMATASMAKFSKGLVDTAGGKMGAAATGLLSMGISAKDATGHILPLNDLLPQVADKFKSMPDGAEKTALSMQLFGRSGTQMLPFLNKGADGLKELEDKAKSMGLTLDDAAIDKFKESKVAQREFQATMQGLQVTLGQAFLPVLEGVQNAFREFLIPLIEKATAYVKAHQKQFDDLGEMLKSLVVPVLNILMGVIEGLTGFIINNTETVKAMLIVVGSALALWKSYQLVMGAVQAAKALMTAGTIAQTIATQGATAAQWLMNAALTANPIGIVVVAIGALVGALIWFFTQTKIGQETWKTFTAFVTSAWQATTSALSTAFTNIGNWFSSLWNGARGAFTSFQTWINGAINKVSTTVGKVFSDMGDAIGAVWDGVVNTVKGALNNVIGAINGAIGTINTLLGAVKTVSGGAINLKIPNIPKLAEGGVVPATPGGRLVRVAEAGEAEAVIPLSKLGSVAGGGGNGMTVNYYAAKNDSISAEQKLIDAVQRARVLGWT